MDTWHDDVMDEARPAARPANAQWGNNVAILAANYLLATAGCGEVSNRGDHRRHLAQLQTGQTRGTPEQRDSSSSTRSCGSGEDRQSTGAARMFSGATDEQVGEPGWAPHRRRHRLSTAKPDESVGQARYRRARSEYTLLPMPLRVTGISPIGLGCALLNGPVDARGGPRSPAWPGPRSPSAVCGSWHVTPGYLYRPTSRDGACPGGAGREPA